MSNAKETIRDLLQKADITINGSNPWDIQVHDERLFERVLSGGRLALGESYMDEWWSVQEPDEFFSRVIRAELHKELPINLSTIFFYAKAKLLNRQSKSRAKQVGKEHYDLGNDLYTAMLDKRMIYSCGYWKEGVKTLDDAQEAKLDLIACKLDIQPGDRILDIGCGWGGLARYLAEKYDVKEVVGVTVSKEQVVLARKNVKGLPVDVRLKDYRSIDDGPFDKVVSVGMFEHVGYKNYGEFMKSVKNLMADEGLFLLHTIAVSKSTVATDPWIDKYIFPNGMLPSISQIGKASENIFVMEDWHNFGADYDKTLMVWYKNFVEAWPKLKGEKYDDRFYRMWEYYLLMCAGLFRARHAQLWQILFSKRGVLGGVSWVR